jgi:hypothetical protein
MNNRNMIVYSSVHSIEQWKSKLLGHVVDAFASDNQAKIQQSISTWRWSDALPFPSANDIRINGGCLTFEVLAADMPIFFSLWYTLGEVRVGVRIPSSLFDPNGLIVKKLSLAYDGSPCQKITALSNGQFFDWIFRDSGDGFASFRTGMEATQDPQTELAIASRLADILIHTYMATMNIIVENRGLKVTFKQIKSQLSAKYITLDLRGDIEAFEFWVRRFGSIEKRVPLSDGMVSYTLSGDETLKGIPHGDVCIDGAWFSILNIQHVNTQARLYGEQK